jgi:hypothetical protein
MDDLTRANLARQVLDAPIFMEAREKVKDGILNQMKAVPITNTEMHTKLIVALQVWNSMESYLDQIVQTGKIAQFQLEQEEKRRSMLQVVGGMFRG